MSSKKKIIFIILVSVLLSGLLNILAGRYLAAKISTWPLLNRWKILSPQTPIVINNTQTVRITDTGDAGQTAEQIKSKISSVVLVNGSQINLLGGAINLTSDGSFVTAAANFNSKAVGTYMVVLNDGRSAAISSRVNDPATSLVFFKASLDNVPVPSLGSSKDLPLGQKIVFVQDSLQNFLEKAVGGIVDSIQSDVEGKIFQSDYPRRGFNSTPQGGLVPGQSLVDSSGDIVGIWNGTDIISSDVLKTAMAMYFQSPTQFNRSAFGFSYSIITKNDSKLTGLPEGVKVITVDALSQARAAGLAVGDDITSVNGSLVTESSGLEEILEKFIPGDKLALNVSRNKQALTLNLTVGELK